MLKWGCHLIGRLVIDYTTRSEGHFGERGALKKPLAGLQSKIRTEWDYLPLKHPVIAPLAGIFRRWISPFVAPWLSEYNANQLLQSFVFFTKKNLSFFCRRLDLSRRAQLLGTPPARTFPNEFGSVAFGESRGWNPVCRPPRKPVLFSSQPRLCAILQFRLLVRNQIWPRWKEQLHGQFHSSRSYQVLRGLAFLGYLAYSLMLNVTLESFFWQVWLTKLSLVFVIRKSVC